MHKVVGISGLYVVVNANLEVATAIYGIGSSQETAFDQAIENGVDTSHCIALEADPALAQYLRATGNTTLPWLHVEGIAVLDVEEAEKRLKGDIHHAEYKLRRAQENLERVRLEAEGKVNLANMEVERLKSLKIFLESL